MSASYRRKKLEMRYQRLLRKKNHERIMKQEQEHTKKLEKELKFADDLENAEDTETRLRATFEKCDVDGDGSLTCDEIRGAVEEMLSEEDLDDLLSDLFGDGAEEVDCDEFVSSMLERIDRKESIPILSDTTSSEEESSEDVDESCSKMKTSFGCPKYLVKILKYQCKLSESYIHVKYMKFRIKSPSGFIGKKALMDLCRQQKPGGNDKDLERYVKMIFWLCGCFSTRWGGLFIDFRETMLSIRWYCSTNKNSCDLLQWMFRLYDDAGRGEISLRKLPKLVRHVVEICGFQFNQEKDQKIVLKNVKSIMMGYDYPYEGDYISEEEFVFDSITNVELFQMLAQTNIKSLHLTNEWDDPDEEFITVVIKDGKNDEKLSTIDTADPETG